MKKKIRIIANPFSGNKDGSKIRNVVDRYLEKSLFDYEICLTAYPGHATELSAQAAAASYFAVIAVGGDGTINEVASVLKGTKTALGIVPMGSGNGFAYHLDIRRNVRKAFVAINGCKTMRIDTGTANGRFFINVAGLGLDASVAYNTRKNKKRGFYPYLLNAIKETLRFKSLKLNIVADGQDYSGLYTSVAVANASVYGYNFSIAPEADLSDGKFDVILLKKANVISYFLAVPRMLTRTIHKSPIIHYFKASEIYIKQEDKCFFHLDGEGLIMEGDITFCNVPASLDVLIL